MTEKVPFDHCRGVCGEGLEGSRQEDDLSLRFNYYNLSKENLERKISEQDIVLKAMMAPVKQLERTLS